jgi:hypothetical protein
MASLALGDPEPALRERHPVARGDPRRVDPSSPAIAQRAVALIHLDVLRLMLMAEAAAVMTR